MLRLLRSAALLTAACALAGCGSNSAGPAAPSPVVQAAPNPKAYLDALLEKMETYSVNKATIDWAGLRMKVVATAGDARAIPELYPAIELALRLLGDDESYYRTNTGALIGPPPVGGCVSGAPTPESLPDTIGYVRVPICDCAGSAITQFAETLQQAIRAADRSGLAGWIVDLRGNIGGNMWPMIAGVGPILGEGIIGWVVYSDREYEREYRNGAAINWGDVEARVADPYTLTKANPRVAVLTDGGVASSGEAIAVFFKGRPDTRSFGTPTCGHHHLQHDFPLSDGAVLYLVSGQHADRTKRRYGGRIAPDEIIADPGEVVSRAVAWLQR